MKSEMISTNYTCENSWIREFLPTKYLRQISSFRYQRVKNLKNKGLFNARWYEKVMEKKHMTYFTSPCFYVNFKSYLHGAFIFSDFLLVGIWNWNLSLILFEQKSPKNQPLWIEKRNQFKTWWKPNFSRDKSSKQSWALFFFESMFLCFISCMSAREEDTLKKLTKATKKFGKKCQNQ